MPAVVTLAPNSAMTYDDVPLPTALRTLEELGADVVGINCFRGPDTMLPLMRDVRKECKVTSSTRCLYLTNFCHDAPSWPGTVL